MSQPACERVENGATDVPRLSGAHELGAAQSGKYGEIPEEISKWGGPRRNSGGVRPGAGRKPKPEPIAEKPWSEPRWSVFLTWPDAELRAASAISQFGFTAYMPLIAEQRRDPENPKHWIKIRVPRFPEYGFVLLTPGDDWGGIQHRRGVRAILRAHDRPVLLPIGEVERCMADDERLCDLALEIMPSLAPLTIVRILEGAFAGLLGTVVRCNGKVTTVELSLFGRPVPTRIPRADVAAPLEAIA